MNKARAMSDQELAEAMMNKLWPDMDMEEGALVAEAIDRLNGKAINCDNGITVAAGGRVEWIMKTLYDLAIESALANMKFASELRPSNERWICVENAVGCLIEALKAKEGKMDIKTKPKEPVIWLAKKQFSGLSMWPRSSATCLRRAMRIRNLVTGNLRRLWWL
jgi:hypothetical protein